MEYYETNIGLSGLRSDEIEQQSYMIEIFRVIVKDLNILLFIKEI